MANIRFRRFAVLSFLFIFLFSGCNQFDSIPDDANPVIAAFAKENNIPYSSYPESLIKLLENNPETTDFVLNYPIISPQRQQVILTEEEKQTDFPLFLQWDIRWGYLTYGSDITAITGCGPLCLSMAAFHLTGNTRHTPDRIIEFAQTNGYYSPGNGSSWTLISEGGKQLGFNVNELPLDKALLFNRLNSGIPVICVVGPGDFTTTGHFLLFTGVEDGLIKINDPNSKANSDKLWDYDAIKGQIKNIWSIEN